MKAYFRKQWLESHASNWYDDANNPINSGCPSTNNGNESINATIKKFFTLREQLNISIIVYLYLSLNVFTCAAFPLISMYPDSVDRWLTSKLFDE